MHLRCGLKNPAQQTSSSGRMQRDPSVSRISHTQLVSPEGLRCDCWWGEVKEVHPPVSVKRSIECRVRRNTPSPPRRLLEHFWQQEWRSLPLEAGQCYCLEMGFLYSPFFEGRTAPLSLCECGFASLPPPLECESGKLIWLPTHLLSSPTSSSLILERCNKKQEGNCQLKTSLVPSWVICLLIRNCGRS